LSSGFSGIEAEFYAGKTELELRGTFLRTILCEAVNLEGETCFAITVERSCNPERLIADAAAKLSWDQSHFAAAVFESMSGWSAFSGLHIRWCMSSVE
jgi:hypothetical protein